MKPFLTIGDVSAAIGVPVAALKTMRHRGYWPADEVTDDEAPAWHRYSVLDAALIACVVELQDAGVSAADAARIVGSGRGQAAAVEHPARAGSKDFWLGVLRSTEGLAHICGPLAETYALAAKSIRRDADDFGGDGGATLVLVNASRHVRRVRAAVIRDGLV